MNTYTRVSGEWEWVCTRALFFFFAAFVVWMTHDHNTYYELIIFFSTHTHIQAGTQYMK